MIPINQLLSRFKNLKNPEKLKKIEIIEILKEKNIPVKLEQISISKNILSLKTPPIIKTEILLKKESILKEIQKKQSLLNINDIV